MKEQDGHGADEMLQKLKEATGADYISDLRVEPFFTQALRILDSWDKRQGHLDDWLQVLRYLGFVERIESQDQLRAQIRQAVKRKTKAE